MKGDIRKNNNPMVFIIIYCVLLLALLITINLAEFKLNEHPLELRGYIRTEESSAKLLIDINTADLHQLCQLPQIGETLAQRIIDHRNNNGKFTDIDQITKVDGIGEATLENIRDLITVG